MKRPTYYKATFCLFFFFALSFVFSQQSEPQTQIGEGELPKRESFIKQVSIDWIQDIFYFEFYFRRDDGETHSQASPNSFTLNRSLADTYVPELLGGVFSDIPVDSQITFLDIFKQNPNVLVFYKDLNWLDVDSGFDENMDYYYAKFQVNLYPNLIGPMISHTDVKPLDKVPNFNLVDNNVTGILIYLPDTLPVRGALGEHSFKPSLFSRVLDKDLNPIISREFVDPQVILRQGAMPYVQAIGSPKLTNIVGENPLIILVEELWGVYKSDMIISNEDKFKILGQQKYRDFIHAGKFAVALNEDEQIDVFAAP